VSRLEFAPKIDGIKITDIKRRLGSFSPKPDKAVSFAVLKEALKKAGYTLASAEITVSGKLAHDDSGWWLVVDPSKQRYALEGANLNQVLADSAPGRAFGSMPPTLPRQRCNWKRRSLISAFLSKMAQTQDQDRALATLLSCFR